MIALVLLVLATEPIQADCRADSDCLISTFPGCCGSCCPMSPSAVSKSTDDAQRRRCAIIDCAAARCLKDIECEKTEPASAFRAVCQRGQCVAVRASPGGECSTDSDCRLDWLSDGRSCGVCGCCPGSGTPVAVPSSKAPPRPPPPPPRPLVKKEEKTPPFGLNPGGAPPPPPSPNCSPCPAPPRVRAVCSVGRCALQRGELFEE